MITTTRARHMALAEPRDWRRIGRLAAVVLGLTLLMLALWIGVAGLIVDAWSHSAPMLVEGVRP